MRDSFLTSVYLGLERDVTLFIIFNAGALGAFGVKRRYFNVSGAKCRSLIEKYVSAMSHLVILNMF